MLSQFSMNKQYLKIFVQHNSLWKHFLCVIKMNKYQSKAEELLVWTYFSLILIIKFLIPRKPGSLSMSCRSRGGKVVIQTILKCACILYKKFQLNQDRKSLGMKKRKKSLCENCGRFACRFKWSQEDNKTCQSLWELKKKTKKHLASDECGPYTAPQKWTLSHSAILN